MSLGSFEHLSVIEKGEALHVTLNRPERLNAINDRMAGELRALFGVLYWRHDIRVVVLAGADRAFCAGFDLKENERAPGDGVSEMLVGQRKLSEIVIAMRRCPQPIIALVDGPAAGGGFALALASDIRIGTPAMRLNAAFIKVGLSACDIGVSYFLPRMVGSSVAAEYLLTGRFVDAQVAEKHGLVSRIVDVEDLQAEAEVMIADLLRATPLGLRLTKDALNHAIDASGLEAVIALEDRNQILAAQGEDFSEGIAAFREKRPPRYGK